MWLKLFVVKLTFSLPSVFSALNFLRASFSSSREKYFCFKFFIPADRHYISN